jgi:transposase
MTQPTPRPVKTDKRAKITHEQREEIVRRRAAGEALAALAAEFGISRQRVDIIAKRQKAPQKRRPKLTRLTPEQQDWLHAKITQSKRTWTLASIEKLILKQFSIHLETAAYMTWLVELGVKIGDYDENVPLSPEFEAYLRSEEARKLREREAVWKANQPAYKPRLGRPRKNPLPPAPPPPSSAPKHQAKSTSPSLDFLDDDDDDQGLNFDDLDSDLEIANSEEALTLEEMLASVEATRKKLAAAGRPVPPVSAWGQKPKTNALGQRLGKHAKASQPSKKNKKKKRKKR